MFVCVCVCVCLRRTCLWLELRIQIRCLAVAHVNTPRQHPSFVASFCRSGRSGVHTLAITLTAQLLIEVGGHGYLTPLERPYRWANQSIRLMKSWEAEPSHSCWRLRCVHVWWLACSQCCVSVIACSIHSHDAAGMVLSDAFRGGYSVWVCVCVYSLDIWLIAVFHT